MTISFKELNKSTCDSLNEEQLNQLKLEKELANKIEN